MPNKKSARRWQVAQNREQKDVIFKHHDLLRHSESDRSTRYDKYFAGTLDFSRHLLVRCHLQRFEYLRLYTTCFEKQSMLHVFLIIFRSSTHVHAGEYTTSNASNRLSHRYKCVRIGSLQDTILFQFHMAVRVSDQHLMHGWTLSEHSQSGSCFSPRSIGRKSTFWYALHALDSYTALQTRTMENGVVSESPHWSSRCYSLLVTWFT